MASVDGSRSIQADSDKVCLYECGPCSSEHNIKEAKHYCRTCNDYLCEDCRGYHRKFKEMRDHKIVSVSVMSKTGTVSQPVPGVRCGCHTNLVELYCETHHDGMCTFCRTVKHRRCQTSSIRDKCSQLNYQDDGSVLKSVEALETKLKAIEHDIQEERNGIGKIRDDCGEKINGFRSNLSALLHRMEKKLLDDLDQISNQRSQAVRHKLTTVANTLEMLQKDKQILEEAEKSGMREVSFAAALRVSKHLADYDIVAADIERDISISVLFEQNRMLQTIMKEENLGKLNVTVPMATIETSSGGPWYLIYEHDTQGNTMYGNKAELIKKVKNGANVRVATSGANPYATSIQNAYQVGDKLCAQALFHISKDGYNKFQEKAYWWFLNISTTGHWKMSRYYVGLHKLVSKDYMRYGLKWFVRDCSTVPILSLHEDGRVVTGGVSSLIDTIQQAHDVQITTFDDRYVFPTDVLQYNSAETIASGVRLWSVSQHEVKRDGVTIQDFQGNDYWVHTLHTTDGDIVLSRWNIGEHTDRGLTNHRVSSKWFSDPCWQQIYKHCANGDVVSGSLSALVAAVKAGHRVKIMVNRTSLEADEVAIRNNHICATMLNDVSKSGISTFETNSSWVWKLACTTGRLETLKYEVGVNKKADSFINSDTMTWFVDTRTWTKFLSVSSNGTVKDGSKQTLVDAVRNGSEVRYTMVRLENKLLLCQQADNLQISGEDVSAQHVWSISTTYKGLSEMKFNADPCWVFTILTTSGRLEMSQWTTGAHISRGQDSLQVAVDWFVNDSSRP